MRILRLDSHGALFGLQYGGTRETPAGKPLCVTNENISNAGTKPSHEQQLFDVLN